MLDADVVHHDRAVGPPDDRVVLEHASMRMEHFPGLERDGVELASWTSQLHPVTDPEWTAVGWAVGGAHARNSCAAANAAEMSVGVRPARVGQRASASASASGTICGTPIVTAPDAIAAASPGTESLDRDAVPCSHAEKLGCLQVGLGVRLGLRHHVAGHDHVERVEADGLGELGRHPFDGHRHERREHALPANGREQLSGAGAPRHASFDELLLHPGGQAGDDRIDVEIDARRLQDRCGAPQAEPDELHAVVVRPGAAE